MTCTSWRSRLSLRSAIVGISPALALRAQAQGGDGTGPGSHSEWGRAAQGALTPRPDVSLDPRTVTSARVFLLSPNMQTHPKTQASQHATEMWKFLGRALPGREDLSLPRSTPGGMCGGTPDFSGQEGRPAPQDAHLVGKVPSAHPPAFQ